MSVADISLRNSGAISVVLEKAESKKTLTINLQKLYRIDIG